MEKHVRSASVRTPDHHQRGLRNNRELAALMPWLILQAMSTLLEIKAALPQLSTEDLVQLDDAVDATLRARQKDFTGNDAVRWWQEHERMPLADADAFASDVEAARGGANRLPV